MSATAHELVGRMVAAGEWPEPALMEAIVARGEEAVGPLIEVVRGGGHGWPEEAPVDHAVGLLSELKSPAAVPALLEVFRRYDNETVEGLPQALRPFGTAVVEAVLEVVRDTGLPWYPRAVAANVALDATEAEPVLRAGILETLRGMLADYVARADSVSEDEMLLASSLVGDLASAADPQARDLLRAALNAGLSDMLDEKDVETYYRKGGSKSRPVEDWLAEYRRHFREEQARKAAPPAPPLLPAPLATPPRLPPLPKAVPVQARRTPGRNEPCWCGSGKKYKNCHLQQDRG